MKLDLFYHVFVTTTDAHKPLYTYLIRKCDDSADALLIQVTRESYTVVCDDDFSREQSELIAAHFNHAFCLDDGETMLAEYVNGASDVLPRHEQNGQEIFHSDLEL